jgi:hypothetical protein
MVWMGAIKPFFQLKIVRSSTEQNVVENLYGTPDNCEKGRIWDIYWADCLNGTRHIEKRNKSAFL